MKYRAKRDFLGVTKGMEFPVDKDGDIRLPQKTKSGLGVSYLDPTKYPDDFELVEEPKYTDSDLDSIYDLFYKYWIMEGSMSEEAVKQAIAELKQSKEKK